MTELKPCPFCGGMPTIQEGDFIWVGCENERCLIQPEGRITAVEDKAEAIEQWNTRAEGKEE